MRTEAESHKYYYPWSMVSRLDWLDHVKYQIDEPIAFIYIYSKSFLLLYTRMRQSNILIRIFYPWGIVIQLSCCTRILTSVPLYQPVPWWIWTLLTPAVWQSISYIILNWSTYFLLVWIGIVIVRINFNRYFPPRTPDDELPYQFYSAWPLPLPNGECSVPS